MSSVRDPVCGQPVDALRARSVGIFGGRTFYFCSPEHKAEFAKNPGAYGTSPSAPRAGAPRDLSPPRLREVAALRAGEPTPTRTDAGLAAADPYADSGPIAEEYDASGPIPAHSLGARPGLYVAAIVGLLVYFLADP